LIFAVGCGDRAGARPDSGPRDAGSEDAPSPDFPDAVPTTLDGGLDAAFGSDATLDTGAARDAGDDAPRAPDAFTAFDAGPCGRVGASCCPGATCAEGACLGGRCVVFGGAFQRDLVDPATPACRVGNPLAASSCACPDGFVEQRVEDADYGVDEGGGFLGPVFVCAASGDVVASDYRGAHGRTTTDYPFSMGCANACTSPARATTMCTCPGGTVAESRYETVHFVRGSAADCERELTFCHGSAAPLTFGGTYFQYRTGDATCDRGLASADRCVPNPETGACSCPEGFLSTALQVGVRRVIDRGFGAEQWVCTGDLVVCQRMP
jgi:hypothetical protein